MTKKQIKNRYVRSSVTRQCAVIDQLQNSSDNHITVSSCHSEEGGVQVGGGHSRLCRVGFSGETGSTLKTAQGWIVPCCVEQSRTLHSAVLKMQSLVMWQGHRGQDLDDRQFQVQEITRKQVTGWHSQGSGHCGWAVSLFRVVLPLTALSIFTSF